MVFFQYISVENLNLTWTWTGFVQLEVKKPFYVRFFFLFLQCINLSSYSLGFLVPPLHLSLRFLLDLKLIESLSGRRSEPHSVATETSSISSQSFLSKIMRMYLSGFLFIASMPEKNTYYFNVLSNIPQMFARGFQEDPKSFVKLWFSYNICNCVMFKRVQQSVQG